MIDQLHGRPVEATHDALGWELPNVDLTEDFSSEDIETLLQASADAGGILVFPNQKTSMTIHDHVRFGRQIADHSDTVLEPHAVAAGHPDAPEVRCAIAALRSGRNLRPAET